MAGRIPTMMADEDEDEDTSGGTRSDRGGQLGGHANESR
jgi:hypothetical protein